MKVKQKTMWAVIANSDHNRRWIYAVEATRQEAVNFIYRVSGTGIALEHDPIRVTVIPKEKP